jgi:hypothetical protein
MYEMEKIFCTGLTRAAKAGQKSLVPAVYSKPTNQPRKDLFHIYSMSPYLSHFQQSAGALVSLAFTLPSPPPPHACPISVCFRNDLNALSI